MIKGKTDKIFEGVCIALSVLLALLCLYPLLYTFGVSICSEAEWTDRNGMLILFPTHPTFLAYEKIFGVGSYVIKALGMSLLRTVVGTITAVAVNALVGYVLSRDKFPGKQAYIYFLLFTIFFSGGLIPNYLVIKELGLLNNFWSMILPNIVSAWNILIFKQFFMGLPKEIEEAATIDGIGELGLFLKIVLPLSTAILATIALFISVGLWNNWYTSMLFMLPHDKRPMAYALQVIIEHSRGSSGENSAGVTTPIGQSIQYEADTYSVVGDRHMLLELIFARRLVGKATLCKADAVNKTFGQ